MPTRAIPSRTIGARAHTAMLNARIIPKLTKLLLDLEKVLAALGIAAPVVVVNENTHGTVVPDELVEIIEKYRGALHEA